MATLRATTSIDMLSDPFWTNWLANANSGVHSATKFVFNIPGFNQTWTFTGTNFGNYIDGAPHSGTVKSVKLTGTNALTLTGVAVPITKLLPYVTRPNKEGLNKVLFAKNDTIVGSNGSDKLNGYAGNDIIRGNSGEDNIYLTGGRDNVDGGAGYDTIFYSARPNVPMALTIAYGAMLRDVGAVVGGNTVKKVEGFDVKGSAGNDVLTLSQFTPPLSGVAEPSGIFWGGGGIDTLVINASASSFVIMINDLGSTISVGDYYINAMVERLVVKGGSGWDIMNGRALNDTMHGGGGGDELYGASGADVLSGGDGDDSVGGGNGADTLSGDEGNDFLNGGASADSLTGGGGQDTFVFNTALGPANVDTITDFTPADDAIRLSSAVFSGLSGGPLNVSALRLGDLAGEDTDDRIIYDPATGALYYDSDGSGSSAPAIKFATLSAGLALSEADFYVS